MTEELHDLYSSPNIIRVSKDDDLGGACGMCGEEVRCVQGFGGETCKKKNKLEDIGVDGRIILKRIFK